MSHDHNSTMYVNKYFYQYGFKELDKKSLNTDGQQFYKTYNHLSPEITEHKMSMTYKEV